MSEHQPLARRLPSPRTLLGAAFLAAAIAQIAACESDAPTPAAAIEKPPAKPAPSTTNTPNAAPGGSHGASPGGSASPDAGAAGSGSPSTSAAPAGSAEAPAVDDTKWSTATSTTVDTSAGPMVIHAVHHGTVYIEVAKQILWVDPYSEGKLDDKPKADFILVTDIHPDHLDEKAIDAVKKAGTVVMGPKEVVDQHPGTQMIANGDKKKLGPIEVEAIAMYNTKRGPAAGKVFHDKGRGNGYVLSYGGKRVYLSGDTECTSEMKGLPRIDVAFVCMNLPYTMPPEEAAECIAAFKPKVAIPYHHRGSDLTVLDSKLAGSGVKVEKLKFY